jgi:hypothetical protein
MNSNELNAALSPLLYKLEQIDHLLVKITSTLKNLPVLTAGETALHVVGESYAKALNKVLDGYSPASSQPTLFFTPRMPFGILHHADLAKRLGFLTKEEALASPKVMRYLQVLQPFLEVLGYQGLHSRCLRCYFAHLLSGSRTDLNFTLKLLPHKPETKKESSSPG